MPSERIIFQTSFTQLLEAVPEPLQPQVASGWKALGVDIDRPLPGYPVETWWRAVELAANALEGAPAERLRRLGRGLTDRFSLSLLGRAVGPLARLTGTRRSLLRSPITFRSGNNYLQTVIEVDEPQRVKLRVNDASPIPELLAGSIEGLVTYTGGLRPRVDIERGVVDTAFDIRWETKKSDG